MFQLPCNIYINFSGEKNKVLKDKRKKGLVQWRHPCPEPHSDSKGKSSSTVVKGAQLGRIRSLVQRLEKRETLNNESPTTSGSIDTIPETSALSHTSVCLYLLVYAIMILVISK
ncbi:hypothetical protein GIB67_016476 [Kingdonia uniflora]|uniref:Uncharacterized protein n=1 Tax=Kingdonia uniflora TaxID=39325 RepID=A0A7J7M8B8_9MAGN|nr:hypothetical protein GIB67_016476 [Kingdonia uniflora]